MEIFLLSASLFYQLVSGIKNLFYEGKIFKPKKAPLFVISVGNITFGGSEKTPLVMNLISFLEREGFKPALISRGYKGRWEQKGGILSDGKKTFGTWEESGDEPYMVAQNFPQAGIFIGKNRLLSCQKAKHLGFKIVLLDDGFQHRRLYRDLDVVLYDPGESIILREPSSSLKRAHLILVKKNLEIKKKNQIIKTYAKAEIFEYSVVNKGFWKLNSEERLPADAFQRKKAMAFCGIARPERFHALLREAGIEIVESLRFPDHYPYPPSSLKKIADQFSQLKPVVAITTEKDAIKITPGDKILKSIPVYYLKIELDLEENFWQRIRSCLQNSA